MSQSRPSISGDSGSAQALLDAPSPTSVITPETSTPNSTQKSLRVTELLKWTFSFPAMLGAILVGSIFVLLRRFGVEPDFWWHLKIGEGILATHHFPQTDSYSFTANGQPWIASEWLGEVLFAGVERVAGLRGLEALLILLGAAILLALYTLCSIRSRNSKAGFVTSTALLILALPQFTLRPQMFGYLFLILTLIALARFRQGHRGAVWFLPVIFLLWVNTHGTWILGLGSIVVYWASGLRDLRFGNIEMRSWEPADRRRLAFVFLLCLAVLPITPYGTRLAAYPFQFAFSLPITTSGIKEWQQMPFNLLGGKIFLLLVLVSFAVQLALELTWPLEDVLLLFFSTLMAFLHIRFLLAFVPFFAPMFAVVLARWVPGYKRKKDLYFVNAILMVSLLAAMVKFFPSQEMIQKAIASKEPVDAVEFLRHHSIPGPVFNSYSLGSYLMWAQAPEEKVFIDGRTELFETAGVFADYLHITLLKPGALRVLNNYQIQSALLEPDSPLATALAALPDWQQIYSDDVSALFMRRTHIAAAAQTMRRGAASTGVSLAVGK